MEVSAADDRGVCYNLVVISVILVVVAIILVVFASIGVVIAVFAKSKGPEFETFFQKFKRYFFSLLADFLTFVIS